MPSYTCFTASETSLLTIMKDASRLCLSFSLSRLASNLDWFSSSIAAEAALGQQQFLNRRELSSKCWFRISAASELLPYDFCRSRRFGRPKVRRKLSNRNVFEYLQPIHSQHATWAFNVLSPLACPSCATACYKTR